MNELEKAYQEIERWHCCAEQEGFVGEEEISYLDYVKNCINNLQSKIDKANEILNKLCVMKPWNDSEEEMRKIYRPIKNTSKQEVYKAICDLRDVLKEDK